MQIIRTLVTSLSLAYLASCTDLETGIVKRVPQSELDLLPRQAPAGEKIVQIVTVSNNNGSLMYFPENIKAEVGSVVQFQFYPKNHTITESSFAAPCKPIAANLTSAMRPGQKSGFVPVTPDTQFRPVYNLIVNDTKPIWIFCGQQPHCQKGMAMVINENTASGNTLEKYKAAAAAMGMSSGAPAMASSTAGASTVTPPMTTGTSMAGPSLAGTTTTAAGQSGTTSSGIAKFTGGAGQREVSGLGMGLIAAGAAFALL